VEKGKDYAPDPALRQLLGDASRAARAMFLEGAARQGSVFWPGRSWRQASTLGAATGFTFVTEDGLDARERGLIYFLACRAAREARQGDDVPVDVHRRGWRGALRREHLSAPRTGQRPRATVLGGDRVRALRCGVRPRCSSRRDQLVRSERREETPTAPWMSTSVPKRRRVTKRNWIYTAPGEPWFTFFRCYGPEDALFDKSWQLPDLETFQLVH
jgi:hypothetical protein